MHYLSLFLLGMGLTSIILNMHVVGIILLILCVVSLGIEEV